MQVWRVELVYRNLNPEIKTLRVKKVFFNESRKRRNIEDSRIFLRSCNLNHFITDIVLKLEK
jgi:hypothetical protein